MTKFDLVCEKLNILKINDSFSKKEFVKLNWGSDDYFSQRSFDVFFCKAKKLFEDKEFKNKNRNITRTK